MSNPNTHFQFRFQPITKSQSILGWTQEMLQSHMKHLINEVIAASSFQNSFVNTLATNALRCQGAVICQGSQTLASSISQEISRGTSNYLSFVLNWTLVGEIVQGAILGTVVLCLSQGIIGVVNALQRKCCTQGGPGISLCGCLGLLIRTLDRFLNPWSSQRHASGQRLIDLSLALQRTDLAVKTLDDRLDNLDMMIDSLKGNVANNYEALVPPKRSVTFSQENDEVPTLVNQAGYKAARTIGVEEKVETMTPPPLPDKKKSKFAIPTTRPRLKKKTLTGLDLTLEMTKVSVPNRATQQESSSEGAQVLSPLLAE